LLKDRGINFNFVGSIKSGAIPNSHHEGHPGWTTKMIMENIEIFLQQNPADVILLHIGTNDIASTGQSSHAEIDAVENIGRTIDKILSVNPKAAIFVATIINFQHFNNRIAFFNQLLQKC